MLKICSPMPTGNGAIVVHDQLARHCKADYSINSYSPMYEYFPFLIRKFSDKNADIIHTTPDYACFHVRKKQPIVVTVHGYMLDDFIQSYSTLIQRIHYRTDLRLFTKKSLEKATIVTAVSQFLANIIREDLGFTGNIEIIPNGVDEKLFKPVSEKRQDKRVKVIFSGNISNKKGSHWLLPILEKLSPNIDIIYTEGLRGGDRLPDHPRLQSIGSISHDKMPDVYQQADILLFPTVREGFGLAAAEAMACGLPVVTTDCSALPELVHQDQGGYLCPIGDVDEFAKRINYLASAPGVRKKMGEYNRQRVEENFTLSKMIDRYNNLFEKVKSVQL